MHHSVLCRHINEKGKVFEVDASVDGVALIGGNAFELGWCQRCQPVQDWAARGGCLTSPPQWWLDPESPHQADAKAICNQACTVRQLCLTTAVEGDTAISGGMTPDERAVQLAH